MDPVSESDVAARAKRAAFAAGNDKLVGHTFECCAQVAKNR